MRRPVIRFEWDDEKNRLNKSKHGVSFEIATQIWNDENYLLIPDAIYEGEQRWIAIGSVTIMTVLIAVHTSVDARGVETIRIISARRATKQERKRYEQSSFD